MASCLQVIQCKYYRVNRKRFPENLTDWEDPIFNFCYFANVNNYFYTNHSSYIYCHRIKNSLSNQITPLSFNNSIIKLKKEKEFLKSFNICKYENVLIESAFFIMRKYSIIKGTGFKGFKLRTKEIVGIIENELKNVNELTFKRKILKVCLNKRIYIFLYLYYLFKHWLYD